MTESQRLLAGRYQLLDIIGRGGMAEVHLGTDLRLGRDVAVKILRQDLAQDPVFIARFRREAQSAAGLNHPNIVSVFDTGEDEFMSGVNTITVPWIVMERVDGVTLRQVLTSGRRISPERALDIAAGVLAALDYSHRHGIVHRDIKPANIMITHQGSVKVMDFGIARAIADATATMTHSNAVMGTAQYLSPEQAKGESVDARSDIYSTGCLLYELLTGKPPFSGESPVAIAYQHVSEAPVPPSQVNPDVPAEYDTVVMKALAKSPAARYATAAEMRADIERLMQGERPKAEVVSEEDRTKQIPVVNQSKPRSSGSRNTGRAGWIAAGAAVLALVVGALVLVAKLISPGDVEQVSVPDLSGLTLEVADTRLQNVGLVLGEATYQISEDRPENTIISQNPTTDAMVDRGTAISVVVSKGADQVQVPNLANYSSPDDARSALEQMNLTLGSVTFEDSDLPANTVLRSDPPAGSYVDQGTAVNIVVSSGKVKIPRVLGLNVDQATALLEDLGFVVAVIEVEDDTVAAGTVLEQAPAEGVAADAGSTVTIIISILPPDPNPTQGDPNA